MNKSELIAEIITRFKEHPIIFTTGYAARIAFSLQPGASNHFYMVGSMGMASAVGRGVASRLRMSPRYPVIVDGDGAVLMGLHCLLLEQETVSGILHIIANDSIYSSTGGQEVPASIGSICGLASAAGYSFVQELPTPETSLDKLLTDAVATVILGNSALLNCHVEPGPEPLGRIELQLSDIATQFTAFINE